MSVDHVGAETAQQRVEFGCGGGAPDGIACGPERAGLVDRVVVPRVRRDRMSLPRQERDLVGEDRVLAARLPVVIVDDENAQRAV